MGWCNGSRVRDDVMVGGCGRCRWEGVGWFSVMTEHV